MSVWLALIIVQTVGGSVPVVNAIPPGPAEVKIGTDVSEKPDISLKVAPAKWTHVDRMTGVEADTYLNVPAITTVTFDSQALCEAGVAALAKQSNIASATCVQTK